MWKIFFLVCIVCQQTFAATRSVEVLPHVVSGNAGYFPGITNINNANKPSIQTKVYVTKNSHKIEDFNTHPQIQPKSSLKTSTTSTSLYTSYVPPPSGYVAYKNQKLPLSINTGKIPVLLPKNDFTKHPGFYAAQSNSPEDKVILPRLVNDDESSADAQNAKHNETIEAAKKLASSLLEASGLILSGSGNKSPNEVANVSTDVYIVKSQQMIYEVPTRIGNDNLKSSAAAHNFYPFEKELDKSLTINQFIFVIKPEKINFLNKLV